MQKYSYEMLKYLYALCMQKMVNKLQNFKTLLPVTNVKLFKNPLGHPPSGEE